MVKDMKFSILNDYYGALLTEHQSEILRLYYDCDLSLGEIGERMNITRQGVREVLVRSEEKLSELEEKLQLVRKVNEIASKIENALSSAEDKKTQGLLSDLLLRIKEI